MKVGVIGGCGVAATNKLLELIESYYTQNGAFRDAHHPEMIVYQATQVPSRSMYLEGRGPSYIEDFIEVGNKLKQIGATHLCMCCNTAHYAIDEIQYAVQLPFINLIEEVVSQAKQSNKTKFGLMAADGCLKGKVYERYFEKLFPEAQIVYPDEELQKMVTKGICNIKNQHRFDDISLPERPKQIFTNVYNQLIEQGAEIVIAGCTDIRVDFKHENVIDSLEILAKTIINLYKNEK